MITYFKNLMTDDKKFIGLVRGLFGGLSAALLTDTLDLTFLSDTVQNSLALVGTFLAFFMRSSTNGTTE